MDSASSSSAPSSASRTAAILDSSPAGRLSLSMVSCSPSKSLMAYQRAWRPLMRAPAMSITLARASSTFWPKPNSVVGAVPFFASAIARSISASMPRPLRAEVSTTGQPKWRESSATLMESPFFSTRSIMFRARTTGMPRSMIWVVRYRLRSRLVASTRLTTTSGLPLMR